MSELQRATRNMSVLKEPDDYHISKQTVWCWNTDKQVVISRCPDELGSLAGATHTHTPSEKPNPPGTSHISAFVIALQTALLL